MTKRATFRVGLVALLVAMVVPIGAATPSPTRQAASSAPVPPRGWLVRGVPVYPRVTSYWENTVRSAPLAPQSSLFIGFWDSHSPDPSINLVGSTDGGIGKYSFATCYGTATDPVWTVTASKPKEHTFQVRCAPNAGSDLDVAPGDGELVFFDLADKVMLEVSGSDDMCDSSTHTCTARYWNRRNWKQTTAQAGLDAQYNPGCPLCLGHRGLDSSVFGVRYGEAAAGKIPHLIKITLPSAVNSSGYVFPYMGGESGKKGIIPEGTRVRLTQAAYVRLRPTLNGIAAKAILDALYRYGAITSDSGGRGIRIKLENGNGYDWSKLAVSNDSLSAVKVTDFEVVKLGWDRVRTRPGGRSG